MTHMMTARDAAKVRLTSDDSLSIALAKYYVVIIMTLGLLNCIETQIIEIIGRHCNRTNHLLPG